MQDVTWAPTQFDLMTEKLEQEDTSMSTFHYGRCMNTGKCMREKQAMLREVVSRRRTLSFQTSRMYIKEAVNGHHLHQPLSSNSSGSLDLVS